MPEVKPPPPNTPEQLATVRTSVLLKLLSDHAGGCLNRCLYCKTWMAEIDRRIPPRTEAERGK